MGRKPKPNSNAKPILPFTEYNTFQGFYKIRPADESHDLNYVFNKCILHVTSWLKERFEKAKTKAKFDPYECSFLDVYPSVATMEQEGFDVFATGKQGLVNTCSGPRFDINILGLKDYGEWTIRIFEPNNGVDKKDPDRLFTTEVALKMTSDVVYLALKTMCKESSIKHKTKASVFRPVFIRKIITDKELIVSEGNIEPVKYTINIAKLNIDFKDDPKKDEFEFLKVICNPKRQMPVVFCPASEGYNKDNYASLIRSFSWNMSGEAYVITDEHGNGSDCYQGLFNKMNTNNSFNILFKINENGKKVKMTVDEAKTKIKDNYLIIYPFLNGNYDIEWHGVNKNIKSAVNPDRIKKLISDEVYQIKEHVGYSLIDRREGSGHPDISHGEVVFYSGLWDKYIEKSDSRTIEKLQLDNEEYKRQLNEMINNRKDYSQDQIKELMDKHDQEFEDTISDLKKQLKDKQDKLDEAVKKAEKADKEKAEFDKNRAKLAAKLKYQDDLIEFFVKLQSVPCEKGNLLDWIEETMGDRVTISTQAKKTYKGLQDSVDVLRLRDACILMYAYNLEKSHDESMPEELYTAIRQTKRMSSFDADFSGRNDSSQKSLKEYNHKAPYHITYSAHTDKMFRIYFDFDETTKKYHIVAISKHI